MRGEEWKREKGGEEEEGRKRRRGLGREDRVRWEQGRRWGEDVRERGREERMRREEEGM